MKVYSAYKPMLLDNEADTAPSVPDKTAASGRQEKSKVDNISSLALLRRLCYWVGRRSVCFKDNAKKL